MCLNYAIVLNLILNGKDIEEKLEEEKINFPIEIICGLQIDNNLTLIQQVFTEGENYNTELFKEKINYSEKYITYQQHVQNCNQLVNKLRFSSAFIANMTILDEFYRNIPLGELMQWIKEQIFSIEMDYERRINDANLNEAKQKALNLNIEDTIQKINKHQENMNASLEKIFHACHTYNDKTTRKTPEVIDHLKELQNLYENDSAEISQKVHQMEAIGDDDLNMVDNLNQSLKHNIELIGNRMDEFYREASQRFIAAYSEGINNYQTIPVILVGFNVDKYLSKLHQQTNEIIAIQDYLQNNITSKEDDIIKNFEEYLKFCNEAFKLMTGLRIHLQNNSFLEDFHTFYENTMKALGAIVNNRRFDVTHIIDSYKNELYKLYEKLNTFKKLQHTYENVNNIKKQHIEELKDIAQTSGYSEQLLETHHAYENNLTEIRQLESYVRDEQQHQELRTLVSEIEIQGDELKNLIINMGTTLNYNIGELKNNALNLQGQIDLTNLTIFSENESYLKAIIFSYYKGDERDELESQIYTIVNKMVQHFNWFSDIESKLQLLSCNYNLLHLTYLVQQNNITQHNEFLHHFSVTALRFMAVEELNYFHNYYEKMNDQLTQYNDQISIVKSQLTLFTNKWLEFETQVEALKKMKEYYPSNQMIENVKTQLLPHLYDHPKTFHSLVDSSIKQLFRYKYDGTLPTENITIQFVQQSQKNLDDDLSVIHKHLSSQENNVKLFSRNLASVDDSILQNLANLHKQDIQYQLIIERLSYLQGEVLKHKTRFSNQSALLDKQIDRVLTQINFQYYLTNTTAKQYQSIQNELVDQKNKIYLHILSLVEFYSQLYGIDCSVELNSIYNTTLFHLDSYIDKNLIQVSNLSEKVNSLLLEFSQHKINHLHVYKYTMNMLTRFYEKSNDCQSDIRLETGMTELEKILVQCQSLIDSYNNINKTVNSYTLDMDSLINKAEQFNVNQIVLLELPSLVNMTEVKSTLRDVKQQMDLYLQHKYHNFDENQNNPLLRYTRLTQLYETIKSRYDEVEKLPNIVINVDPPNDIYNYITGLIEYVKSYVDKFHKLKASYNDKGVQLWKKPFSLSDVDFYHRAIGKNLSVDVNFFQLELMYSQLIEINKELYTIQNKVHQYYSSIQQHYTAYNQLRDMSLIRINNATLNKDQYDKHIQQLVMQQNLVIKSIEMDGKKILKFLSYFKHYHHQFVQLQENYGLFNSAIMKNFSTPQNFLIFKQENYFESAFSHSTMLTTKLTDFKNLRDNHTMMGEISFKLKLKIMSEIEYITHKNKLNHEQLIKKYEKLLFSVQNSKQLIIADDQNANGNVEHNSAKIKESTKLRYQLDEILQNFENIEKLIFDKITSNNNNYKSRYTTNKKIYKNLIDILNESIEQSFNYSRIMQCCAKILLGYECTHAIAKLNSICNKNVSDLDEYQIKDDLNNPSYTERNFSLHNKTLYNYEHDLSYVTIISNALNDIIQSYNAYKIMANDYMEEIRNNYLKEILIKQFGNVKASHKKLDNKYELQGEKFTSTNKVIVDRLFDLKIKIDPIFKDCDLKKKHFLNQTNTAQIFSTRIRNLVSNQFIENSLESTPLVEQTFSHYTDQIDQACDNVAEFLTKLKQFQSNHQNIINYEEQLDIRHKQLSIILFSDEKFFKSPSVNTEITILNIENHNQGLVVNDLSLKILQRNNTINQMKLDMARLTEDINILVSRLGDTKKQLMLRAAHINQIFASYKSNEPSLWKKLNQLENFALKLNFRSEKLIQSTNSLHLHFNIVKAQINSAHDHLSLKLEQTKNETDVEFSKLKHISSTFFQNYYNQIMKTIDTIQNNFSYQLPIHLQHQHQELLTRYQSYISQFHINMSTIKQFYHQKQIYYNTEFHKYNSYVANLEEEMNGLIINIDDVKQSVFVLAKDEIDTINSIDHKIEQIGSHVLTFIKKTKLFNPTMNEYLQHLSEDLFIIEMEFSNSLSDHLNLLKNILFTLESKRKKQNKLPITADLASTDQKNPLHSNSRGSTLSNTFESQPKYLQKNKNNNLAEKSIQNKIWISSTLVLSLVVITLVFALFLHRRQRKLGERELYNRCSHIYRN